MTFDEYPPSGLCKELQHEILSDSGLVLLQSLLTYDPNRRITAKKALQHKYFEDDPVAKDPAEFLKSLDLEYDHEDRGSHTGDDGQSDSDTRNNEQFDSSVRRGSHFSVKFTKTDIVVH
ncbi:hypothetical protein SFRURICE_017932 [Spodoptera frugiperda]|nr:hypothetical protein SFRURICE_017932 [Spodoptera frugiperda]